VIEDCGLKGVKKMTPAPGRSRRQKQKAEGRRARLLVATRDTWHVRHHQGLPEARDQSQSAQRAVQCAMCIMHNPIRRMMTWRCAGAIPVAWYLFRWRTRGQRRCAIAAGRFLLTSAAASPPATTLGWWAGFLWPGATSRSALSYEAPP
jgi:hypothetical protein